MATSAASDSAFVAHDLTAPLPGAPTGPLTDLTAVVKDTFDIEGERTGAGNPQWLATHHPAAATSSAVRLLLDAGATITGKTVCDEFVYSITGANAHYGTPRNPRAPDRLPGGSSSGSASATAAGACDIGLGTDTGGSIRVPASLCGLFGIRPTHGRVDGTGTVAMAPSFDTVGWLAPSGGLLRRVGRVLLTGTARDAAVTRALLPADLLDTVDPEVRAAFEHFLGQAGDHLPAAERVVLAEEGIAAWVECFRVVQAHETWASFGPWMRVHDPALGPGVEERMRAASQVSAADVEVARAACARVRARLRALVVPGTVLLLPTTPSPAPRLDAGPDDLQHFRGRTMALTCVAGLGGLPQVSMPMGSVEGAPAGASLIGWPGGDEVVLELAAGLAARCAVGEPAHDSGTGAVDNR